MNVYLILWILFLHWVFDFLMQSDEMALNKSKSLKWLCHHTATYSLVAIPMGVALNIPILQFISLYCYLFTTHTLIDGATSRITSYLWKKEERHWFFVVVGLDQVLHYATIFIYLANRLGK